MARTDTKDEPRVADSEEHRRDENGGGNGNDRPQHQVGMHHHDGPAALALYKPGQGKYVRWATAAGAAMISLGFANFLFEQLAGWSDLVRYLTPVGVLVVMGVIIFRMLGQNVKIVEFLIATEGEMRKVNWSTRKEVLGATKVVCFTLIALGFVLFLVDVGFIAFFEAIGVLRLGLLQNMFGGATG